MKSTSEPSQLSSNHMEFKKNIIDLLESYQHKIIHSVDKDDSVFRDAKEGAEIVVDRIIGVDNIVALKRGRLYNRGVLANILTEFWERSTTEDVDFWKDLIDNTETLHKSILRNDANQCIYPVFEILSDTADAARKPSKYIVTSYLQENSEVNEELSQAKEFTEYYTDIIGQCRIQEYASMISQLLRLQYSGEKYQAQVKACKEFVAMFFNDSQKQKMLSVFQQPSGFGPLKAPEEVDPILAELAHLENFQAFFTETLRAWEAMALSKPTLVKLQYGVQPNGASRLVDGNIKYKSSKALALQQATKGLSKAQRNGPDPTSIAEAIASKAIPDRNEDSALKTGEAGSLPDTECTVKKRKTMDATTSSPVQDGGDTRVRPIRRKIPTNFFHIEFSQKEGLLIGEDQGEKGDILMNESGEEKSHRRPNTGIGDTTCQAKTSGTKMSATPVEKIASRKSGAREEATIGKSGSDDDQLNLTHIPTEFSPLRDLNFPEKQIEMKIRSTPIIDHEEEKPAKFHGVLAPAMCNNNNASNKSPPRKKTNKPSNQSEINGKLEATRGALATTDAEHTDNNQENQEVLATSQVEYIESKETARERKKRETTVTFDDSDCSVSSPSAMPPNNRQTSVAASNHLQESMGSILGKRRRAFTQEEKNALRLGIKKFGVGKWSLIKSEYNEIFRYRTAVQIKDLYRTLAKNSDL